MCHKKQKLTQILGTKLRTEPSEYAGPKTSFYPISIMLQIFTANSIITKLKM